MRRARVLGLLLAVYGLFATGLRAADETLTPERIEQFLKNAKIVRSKPIGKGVTQPWRLTLSDGELTHDAAFQSVDREREHVRFKDGREERRFRDFYGYNIAAYRLARLLGCDDLVPVSVERRWQGRTGALTWWVAKKWDEDERVKLGVKPPDLAAWERQVYRGRIFTALIEDTDRNLGNQLVTEDFHLWMIDFTRAFRRSPDVPHTALLRRIDRELFERLRSLTVGEIVAALDPHVGTEETRALIERRDVIVAHFTKIAAERGDHLVFY
jgi:hypothetical protein